MSRVVHGKDCWQRCHVCDYPPFRVHNAVVDFIKRRVCEHDIAPRLIQDLLENFQADVVQDGWRNRFFSGIPENFKK